MPSPVLVIGFKRPERMLEIFDILHRSGYRDVFVSLDAPRTGNASDAAGCEKVLSAVNSYLDRLQVTLNRFVSNRGAGKGVYEGISWFFSKVDSGIIIEDDCIPAPSFLEFCSRSLEYYQSHEEVGLIAGCQFAEIPLGTQALVRHQVPITWGWATWKNRWEGFRRDISHLSTFDRFRLARKQALEFRQCIFYVLAFKLAEQEKLDAWDLQWALYNWSKQRHSLASPTTLITYRGMDENATHTSKEIHLAGVQMSQNASPQFNYGSEIYDRQFDSQTADFIHSSSSYFKLLKMAISTLVPRALFKAIRRLVR